MVTFHSCVLEHQLRKEGAWLQVTGSGRFQESPVGTWSPVNFWLAWPVSSGPRLLPGRQPLPMPTPTLPTEMGLGALWIRTPAPHNTSFHF